jgi:polysaccharide chain length determinant protein (PEP-CTERM system associated)
MEELITKVTTIAKGMWRFRWPALAVAWLVAIIGTIIVFRIPDKYEASARIYVDTQSILKPLMQGLAIQPNVEQQVAMLSRTLLSRPNMERLVRMADLDLKAGSKAEQDEVVTALLGSVQIKSTGRDNLYVLSYSNPDPDKSKRVVQSLVSMFVESSLGSSRKDAQTAKSFLDEQIKNYETKLEEAEKRLKDFRIRNIDIQTAEGKDSASQLGALREQLSQARLALKEAEQSRDAVKAQLQGQMSGASSGAGGTLGGSSLLDKPTGPLAGANIATPEIDARIDVQKRNLDALLQRYTDQHPDVLNTRRLIADLEDQKRREVDELQKAAAAAAASAPMAEQVGGNVLAQEMSRMMAATEVQLAAMRARVEELSVRFNNARESLKSAPALEAEAMQLNRDYEVHRTNYQTLVARREAASMSGELEGASGVADFRLIDPPRVTPQPVSPNRLLLAPLALLISLAAGLFTAFAGSQLRPVFFDANEMRQKLEIPLLGVVSRVVSPAELRQARAGTIRFMLGSGGLLASFVVLFVILSIMAARRAG